MISLNWVKDYIDLTGMDLKELAVKVNGYLANVAVSYVKLHNLHWNVVGPQFKAVHEYLESIYDAYAAVLDAVAELLKMQDEMPLSRMSDYLAVASIKEIEAKESDPFDNIHILQIKHISMLLQPDIFKQFPHQIIHIICRTADNFNLILNGLVAFSRSHNLLI